MSESIITQTLVHVRWVFDGVYALLHALAIIEEALLGLDERGLSHLVLLRIKRLVSALCVRAKSLCTSTIDLFLLLLRLLLRPLTDQLLLLCLFVHNRPGAIVVLLQHTLIVYLGEHVLEAI